MLLPSAALFLFFAVIFSNNIKAQIVNIISEDGDGIVGITSLMNATINEDVQSVKFFAKSGITAVNQKNIGGATALHIAARNGNVQIAEILIENGANVNVADNEGWTPLMRAALNKNSELIKIFLNAGANARKMNSLGETAIIHATSSGCLDCLEQLFSRYNFVENTDVDTLKKQLELAIIIANNKNNTEIEALIREYMGGEVIKNKIYNFATQGNNSEMPVMVNDNIDNDGVVIVRSLDGKNTSYKFNKLATEKRSVVDNQNKKPIYKFLAKKDQIIPPQNNEIRDSSNIPTAAATTSKLENSKSFIFKGNKKFYTPFISTTEPESTKVIQENVGNGGSSKNFIDDQKMKKNIINNTISLSPPTQISSDTKAENKKPKYSFLGQKSSAPVTKQNESNIKQEPQNLESKSNYHFKINSQNSNISNQALSDKKPIDKDKNTMDNQPLNNGESQKEIKSSNQESPNLPAKEEINQHNPSAE
ncbi:MAG: ankyrin repeat domain-containing protein [Pseudomonadota bacterium]